MPSPLDAECLFVAVGLDRILKSRPMLHKYELERAAGLPAEIRKRLARFMASDDFEPAKDMPEFDYDQALEVISAGQTKAQTNALMAMIPDNELATDIGIQAKAILDWANGVLPREHKPSIAGEMRLETPAASTVADFRRQWDVARTPMIVLDDLEDGSLIDDQVATLAKIYPALYADITQAIQDTLASIRARKGIDWDPGPTKTALLGTLQQRETIDPELTATVQAVYAQKEAQEQKPPPPSPGVKSKQQPELTPGQKAQGGATGVS